MTDAALVWRSTASRSSSISREPTLDSRAAPASHCRVTRPGLHKDEKRDTLLDWARTSRAEDPPRQESSLRRAPLPNEFHVSRAARDRCRFDESLFSSSGRAVLAHPAAAHRFAAALNTARGGSAGASAADLFALGLLDEAAHLAIAYWRNRFDPNGFRDALAALEQAMGPQAVHRVLLTFAEVFPIVAVYRGRMTATHWLAGATDGRSHREVALEELLLLVLTHENPACRPYHDLFDDAPLAAIPAYRSLLRELERFLGTRPGMDVGGQLLLEFLRAPMRAAPNSLADQLAYVRAEWGAIVGDLMTRMRLAFDLRREEERWLASRTAAAGGTHTGHDAGAPDYSLAATEDERFSTDAAWMPRTVMIAKSTLVWLDQLSRRHGRAITRLDQVPDAELDRLAAFGITALWLIGVWERSSASRRIKQHAGNTDAAASAYAVDDYAIAHELGGEDAWYGLSERAGRRGIRLASDMVPNHMGIDSRWVLEHPEWFLQRADCPYPSYSFEGPELSHDDRVSVRIEDHYWDRSDAAVVFRRVDRATGDTRYLYHGNDGTSFPWNDTAQLDYLNPAAREAVIQAILGVARRFPIIRFDAAMTLAKKHIQRLWFPEPGHGGDIPSRSGLGVTRAEFDRLMPQEFWREVVDRVAVEAPGTLLLAEAFWLMEGYFVRTLGMHRVYNSAFMVMLRDERNADYRRVLRDTLEFDPDILQRWVNFLNNPDERTAVDQFGRGEKYFGVCMLMATMPGLPMFGHGQIEGHEERYGMEFRRALRDEPVDEGLEREHWRRLVPLLHRRPLFAGAREFRLYDCHHDHGGVNEDVFAYSNRDDSGAALVVYHNRHADAHGTIRVSTAFADKRPDGSRPCRQTSLLEGLGFDRLPGEALLRCRDQVTGNEHLFRVSVLRDAGYRVALGAFGSCVLIDWQEVPHDSRDWDELASRLGDQGARDLESALWDLRLEPVQRMLAAALRPAADATPATRRELAVRALETLTNEAMRLLAWAAVDLNAGATLRAALEQDREPDDAAERVAQVAWRVLGAAGRAFDSSGPGASLRLFDELRLRSVIALAARDSGADSEYAWRLAARVRARLAHPAATADAAAWERFLTDDDARFAAGVATGAAIDTAPAWLSSAGGDRDAKVTQRTKPATGAETKAIDPSPKPAGRATPEVTPASPTKPAGGPAKRNRP